MNGTRYSSNCSIQAIRRRLICTNRREETSITGTETHRSYVLTADVFQEHAEFQPFKRLYSQLTFINFFPVLVPGIKEHARTIFCKFCETDY